MDDKLSPSSPLGSVGAAIGAQTQSLMTVEEIKAFRVEVDALIEKSLKIVLPYGNGVYLLKKLCEEKVFEHLTEAKMWLGKCLEASGNPFPAELADKSK